MTSTPAAGEAPLLAVLLGLEHGLLYGAEAALGSATTHSANGGLLALINDCVIAHRDLRDSLSNYLDKLKAIVPAPAPAYALPNVSRDVPGAVQLALAMEDRAAATWMEAVGRTGDVTLRGIAADAVVAAVVRAARIRRATGASPDAAVPAFPGR